ncbi:type II toxin-antitoxin system VapC family toxin [Microcoleus sp. FACHB-SPT15]|uniref:type II toxin-antitoxin system VapC family toxin n=1 Tax=Microcoleus sp. FACHB-SPT15 TaxID=2692830 RepID=UPI0017825EAA|nr:type II toxin-antitoxin system VapC family toxin [Microcoleus sp. FACHB-SPT15]MBD1805585.1 type II toxin-antitoxin system VapC family toxin [Microcoleus sp. FACHB-SPT15]
MSNPQFLLDTNILSEPLRPVPNPSLMELLVRYSGLTATATVVFHEMLYGCYRLPNSRKRQAIEAYLREEVGAKLLLLPYSTEAAKWHAYERARLVGLGKTPSYVDTQIAAIAVVNNLVLVTNNEADYADFQDIQIENWFVN